MLLQFYEAQFLDTKSSLKDFIKVAQVPGVVEEGFVILEHGGWGEGGGSGECEVVDVSQEEVWLVAELQDAGQAAELELGLATRGNW